MHQHHQDALVCRAEWRLRLLPHMALARGVDHEEYLAVAKDAESDHVIEMSDYMARMMNGA